MVSQLFPLLYEVFQTFFIATLLFTLLQRKKWIAIGDVSIAVIIGFIVGMFNVFMTHRSYYFHQGYLLQLGSPPQNYAIVASFLWGTVIYFSMRISDRYQLSLLMKAVLDGILGVVTDLTIDIIAIRLNGGLWSWTIPLETMPSMRSLLGVPFGNYLVWFLIMIYASLIIRLSHKLIQKNEKKAQITKSYVLYFTVVPIMSLAGIMLFYTLSEQLQSIPILFNIIGLFFLVIVFYLVLRILWGYQHISKSNNFLEIMGLASFHIFFLGSYLLTTVFSSASVNFWILVIPIVMASITFLLIIPCYTRNQSDFKNLSAK